MAYGINERKCMMNFFELAKQLDHVQALYERDDSEVTKQIQSLEKAIDLIIDIESDCTGSTVLTRHHKEYENTIKQIRDYDDKRYGSDKSASLAEKIEKDFKKAVMSPSLSTYI